MVRAPAAAWWLSAMPGNRRRNSRPSGLNGDPSSHQGHETDSLMMWLRLPSSSRAPSPALSAPMESSTAVAVNRISSTVEANQRSTTEATGGQQQQCAVARPGEIAGAEDCHADQRRRRSDMRPGAAWRLVVPATGSPPTLDRQPARSARSGGVLQRSPQRGASARRRSVWPRPPTRMLRQRSRRPAAKPGSACRTSSRMPPSPPRRAEASENWRGAASRGGGRRRIVHIGLGCVGCSVRLHPLVPDRHVSRCRAPGRTSATTRDTIHVAILMPSEIMASLIKAW
jgi:hypothetical protein